MPIASHEYSSKDKNAVIFSIQDNQGYDIIKVKREGEVEIDSKLEVGEAAAEFWQSVADFFPVDAREHLRNKLLLIKMFAKLRDTLEQSKFDEDSLRNIVDELKEQFYYPS